MIHNSIGRVYVWQLPVRFYHWVNALVVGTLAVTGYLIGS
ncbi:MAG: Ni/Fe-hydrogenase, b-type cytochrome subunit, partial [Bacteroidetes bacterium]|nr:Ni/Fe-hydrogenase, b-type cytochrome subunit [Bacteroidota bacterium]